MKLTLNGLTERSGFEQASIRIPDYDIRKIVANTKKAPRWAHFGIGNIFRIFIGGAADDLIEKKLMDTGITCIETFDFDVVDRIYAPYDNLVLCVTMHENGDVDKRVTGSLTEAIAARPGDTKAAERLEEIFTADSLQLVSFTITEKGYELFDENGNVFPRLLKELSEGPDAPLTSAMTIVTAGLNKRFLAGGAPLSLVSMDNVSQNGSKLRSSVLEVAKRWMEKGFISEEAFSYISDESRVSFPWTMIDKITPRPDENVRDMLIKDGMEDMDIVVTDKRTYIAPFVNAEAPQYLVVEDSFPNGRPAFEEAGIYVTDRETVNASERMKVTVCLNPIHSALGPYGVLLGYHRFSDVIADRELNRLAGLVGPKEGMQVVIDPGILSPEAFMEELMTKRFPNPYIPDTPERLCTDISQGLSVRFGVTIKAFTARDGNAGKLLGIPLGIAGWLRYLMGVTDELKAYELAPDPLNPQLRKELLSEGVEIGDPDSLKDQLRPILSNTSIFGIDLYEAGIGERIEEIFREEIAGKGAVRRTLEKYLAK